MTLEPACIDIRYYHYVQDNDIYIFSNENTGQAYVGDITVPTKGDACIYDAWDNVLRPLDYTPCDEGTRLHLDLKPYNPVIVVFGDKGKNLIPEVKAEGTPVELKGWKVSMCEGKQYPAFGEAFEMEELNSIATIDPNFSGFIRYEKSFEYTKGEKCVLELTDAYEGVEVWCNGQYIGMSICPDHIFDLTDAVKEGKNDLRIECYIARPQSAEFGGYFQFHRYAVLDPTGLLTGEDLDKRIIDMTNRTSGVLFAGVKGQF